MKYSVNKVEYREKKSLNYRSRREPSEDLLTIFYLHALHGRVTLHLVYEDKTFSGVFSHSAARCPDKMEITIVTGVDLGKKFT